MQQCGKGGAKDSQTRTSAPPFKRAWATPISERATAGNKCLVGENLSKEPTMFLKTGSAKKGSADGTGYAENQAEGLPAGGPASWPQRARQRNVQSGQSSEG